MERNSALENADAHDGALGSKDRVPEVLGSAELREEASWMATNSAHPPYNYKRAAAALPPQPLAHAWPRLDLAFGPQFSEVRILLQKVKVAIHPSHFPSRVLKI